MSWKVRSSGTSTIVAPPEGPVLTLISPWTSNDFSASRIVLLLTENIC